MTDIVKIIGWSHHSRLFMFYEQGFPTPGAEVFDRSRPLKPAALHSPQDWQMRVQK